MPGRRRDALLLPWVSAIVVVFGAALFAQSPAGKEVAAPGRAGDDPDYARAVTEWTTRPEFSSPLVDHLPKISGIPSPKDVLGHHIGAPKKLTYYADVLRYYRPLAAARPRVKLRRVRASGQG